MENDILKQIKLVIDNDVLEQYEAYYFAIHRKASKKPIAHPYHESINTWMIMKRPMMNALKQKWKDFIVWLIRAQGYANLHIEQCEVEQTVYYPNNRRHDIDNSVPKFILDGMVESGLILDDDWKVVRKITLCCCVDEDYPRTELLIKIFNKESEGNKNGE